MNRGTEVCQSNSVYVGQRNLQSRTRLYPVQLTQNSFNELVVLPTPAPAQTREFHSAILQRWSLGSGFLFPGHWTLLHLARYATTPTILGQL